MDLEEIQQKQPILNIGMLGHVSDGKSTIVQQISKIKTQKFAKERGQGKTIYLGYANAKIYKCFDCKAPECYQSFGSEVMKANCEICNKEMKLMKHISFVDCPGHHILMATMLTGTEIMDTSILVESVTNPTIPAPQTKEHYVAREIMGIPLGLICMNKI